MPLNTETPESSEPISSHALKSKGVFKRLLKAFKYAFQGLRAAWRYEASFKTEVFILILVCMLLGLFKFYLNLPLSALQYLLLFGVWLLVLIVELLNSSVEAVVDLVSPNIHPLAGRAKDFGSAAVLLTILLACMTWVSVLYTY